jgi:hypothetical protein
MEQKCLLAKVREFHEEMMAEMKTNEERLEAKIEGNKQKFEVLRGTLVSRMDAHQSKTEANHEESMAAMKASQERMDALMDDSLKMTKACVEKIEVNQGKVESRWKRV